ncbi:MAG: hypothetical protein IT449_02035 [Phycisphaerales bacterium]|nr:hypothetical protein [Phycisphaerales bacterium]
MSETWDQLEMEPPTALYAPARRLEACIDGFYRWDDQAIAPAAAEPDSASEGDILRKLGPSPFERGGFPLVGFLATVYEKVGRDARTRLQPDRMQD